MKKNFPAMLAAAALALVPLSGCVSNLEGQSKPGVPFSKDTLENRYERPVDQVFAAARKVLEFNGTLNREDTINKTLAAKIDTRTVWVKVEEVEPKVSRCRVQARKKTGTGDIDLASRISNEITARLAANAQ